MSDSTTTVKKTSERQILESLSLGVPLLATQRRRCLSLIGKTREDVLRSDRQATRFLLSMIGLMAHGRETTLDQVCGFLGTNPPEWMQEAEFVNRARRLMKPCRPGAEAREQLEGYVAEILEELQGQAQFVAEVTERPSDRHGRGRHGATPAGTRLANQVDKIDRGCMSAIRRLESRQKPDRRGPKRDAKKPSRPRRSSATWARNGRPSRPPHGPRAGGRCGRSPGDRRGRGADGRISTACATPTEVEERQSKPFRKRPSPVRPPRTVESKPFRKRPSPVRPPRTVESKPFWCRDPGA